MLQWELVVVVVVMAAVVVICEWCSGRRWEEVGGGGRRWEEVGGGGDSGGGGCDSGHLRACVLWWEVGGDGGGGGGNGDRCHVPLIPIALLLVSLSSFSSHLSSSLSPSSLLSC